MTEIRTQPENTLRVESFADLMEALFDSSWNPTLERFRSPYAFRGLAQDSYSLLTTLSRLGGDFATMEAHVLRSFRKYAPRSSVEVDSVFHWLSLGQQHGLPTRLLDWTFSPFVALHFAT
ncbi:MAG TPA: FRG domain-containing protein, partial [Polyangiaceae bacterium]|nr:FRG domain-containing protein [Polyangiaceae bacterium]